MGVLLMSEGVHPRVEVSPMKVDVSENRPDNNNLHAVRNENDAKTPSPPKKKWIQHYLLGETNIQIKNRKKPKKNT